MDVTVIWQVRPLNHTGKVFSECNSGSPDPPPGKTTVKVGFGTLSCRVNISTTSALPALQKSPTSIFGVFFLTQKVKETGKT